MDATYHAVQNIIYALHNPSTEIPLVKLLNEHQEALKTLAEIFRKANPPVVPPRVQVMEVGQKKTLYLNQEGTQMKITPQSKPFTNAELLRVPFLETYSDEIQPVNIARKRFFFGESEARI